MFFPPLYTLHPSRPHLQRLYKEGSYDYTEETTTAMTHLVAPFSMVISGPSSAGKSTLVGHILTNSSCIVFPEGHNKFDQVFIIYRSLQPLYQKWQTQLENIVVTLIPETNCPSTEEVEEMLDGSKNVLFIFDDISTSNCDAKLQTLLQNLFSRLRHHKNISVCLLVQTLYDSKGGVLRFLHRNASYIVLFKFPRDVSQLRSLISQMFALADKKQYKSILCSLQNALSEPYSYLFFDCSQQCPDPLRVRQNIVREKFPHKSWIIAFPHDVEKYKYDPHRSLHPVQ